MLGSLCSTLERAGKLPACQSWQITRNPALEAIFQRCLTTLVSKRPIISIVALAPEAVGSHNNTRHARVERGDWPEPTASEHRVRGGSFRPEKSGGSIRPTVPPIGRFLFQVANDQLDDRRMA